MAASFFEQPILNSPYEAPRFHHLLDADGQPVDAAPVAGRRRSELTTPVPKPRNRPGRERQTTMTLGDARGVSDAEQEYNPTPVINEIRSLVESWRALPNPADWGVTPTTARLLAYWRAHEFHGVKPFFCQIEAVETIVWLTEVAPKFSRGKAILANITAANAASNPELYRLAMKMATGAGKTTVMAMLIAWQTANAIRSPGSGKFGRGFLIIAPGVTIRDRLRVLRPEDPDNYYTTRELVPSDLVADIAKAKIVITNYHAFRRRETMEVSKTTRALIQGPRGAPVVTIESEGAMLVRACGPLIDMPKESVVVINDEAHHCYRERPPRADEKLDAEEKEEAKKANIAARLWISGIEALKRKRGIKAVYDLSATPFFLRGSGYKENSLFPWVVSDFSLMDAIESGIVKLPRVPIDDSLPSGDMPLYRDLWKGLKERGVSLPKKGASKAGELDPSRLPPEIQTALNSLYSHYLKVDAEWRRAGIVVPPVFIVVCANTAISKLVYEWIAGFQRLNEDGEPYTVDKGQLELFRNFDEHGARLPRPNTLLIDSEQIESGDALDPSFREAALPEIEQLKRELAANDGADGKEPSDAELLREAMNTVGKRGRLGESIRCVVSVSMLTEGWDTNNVTHILGLRAFGSQLLCEQVVGRALRRWSYQENDKGLFNVEYADILGIPFDFTRQPVVAPVSAPKPVAYVKAVKERAALEIVFPRVEGYRVELPDERLEAQFTPDSRLVMDAELVGPCVTRMSGIVGESIEITPAVLEDKRYSSIVYDLAVHLLDTRFRDPGEPRPSHLFGQARRVVRRWMDEGYLVAKDVPLAAVTYRAIADQAAERIYLACQRAVSDARPIKAILDPYNPRGSTRHVGFSTSKDLHMTDPDKSHVDAVVCDSDWEAEMARVIERNSHVIAYVKNQGLGFEIPYRDGAIPRKYVPDFIVKLDDGGEEPLNLVVETKGFRGHDAQLKAETMRRFWVPGVNNLGTHGRWDFAEFQDGAVFQSEFDALVRKLVERKVSDHAA
jgi:type III restriction enzyme